MTILAAHSLLWKAACPMDWPGPSCLWYSRRIWWAARGIQLGRAHGWLRPGADVQGNTNTNHQDCRTCRTLYNWAQLSIVLLQSGTRHKSSFPNVELCFNSGIIQQKPLEASIQFKACSFTFILLCRSRGCRTSITSLAAFLRMSAVMPGGPSFILLKHTSGWMFES